MEREALAETPKAPADLGAPESPATEEARQAILGSIEHACRVPLAEALDVQAKHSAGFKLSTAPRKGRVGSAARKTQSV